MPVFLDEIVAASRTCVAERKRLQDVRELERRAEQHRPRGFADALRAQAASGIAVIAELKKASPSKGLLRGSFHVGALAREYQDAGAAALSVLTEEQYFQGSLANLCEASAATRLPCLRKDFIFDEFQLLEARASRADAVLLIAAMLVDAQLRTLYERARGLELDVLCEVHDSTELRRALAAGVEMVGVNSRNLRTFAVDLTTAVDLAQEIPNTILKVAESGIQSSADIERLRAAGYEAFLVGEALMRAESPGAALAAMLQGSKEARA